MVVFYIMLSDCEGAEECLPGHRDAAGDSHRPPGAPDEQHH